MVAKGNISKRIAGETGGMNLIYLVFYAIILLCLFERWPDFYKKFIDKDNGLRWYFP